MNKPWFQFLIFFVITFLVFILTSERVSKGYLEVTFISLIVALVLTLGLKPVMNFIKKTRS
jgi:hypothetical protein